MPEFKLKNGGMVSIILHAENAMELGGGLLSGGLPGEETVVPSEPRRNASTIEWRVPAEKGAGYALVAAVPRLGEIPENQHVLRRTISQLAAGIGSDPLPAESPNPKTLKLSRKTPAGDFRYSELIDFT